MSSLTSLYGGGGGGTPVNSIAQLYVGGQTQYTDESGGVWLKTGNIIVSDPTTYPDAYVTPNTAESVLFTQKFPVDAQEINPTGLAFNTDGTKMFVVGVTGNDVNEYALSTAFDVSTASFTQLFSVSAQDSNPRDVSFNNDGTKMYIVGSTRAYQYTLSAAFDISTAVYANKEGSYFSQQRQATGMAFNNDGTKMFIVGQDGQTGSLDVVHSYTLSTAFDVSTLSNPAQFDVGSQETFPTGIAFNTDGTKMFIVGSTGDDVNEYALSTGFNLLSTVSFTTNFSVASQDNNPQGIAFNNDGTKMFILGSGGDDVIDYSLLSPFSLSKIDGIGLPTDTGTYDYVKLK